MPQALYKDQKSILYMENFSKEKELTSEELEKEPEWMIILTKILKKKGLLNNQNTQETDQEKLPLPLTKS